MNFLQKGLAGLESRLDKVLLDDSSSSNEKPVVTTQPTKANMATTMEIRRGSSEVRRSGEFPRRSGESVRTTMQERLAAAMSGGRASPVSTLARSGSIKKPASEEVEVESSGRESLDSTPPLPVKTEPEPQAEPTDTATVTPTDTPKTNGTPKPPAEPDPGDTELSREDLLLLVTQLREDLSICETRRQEETHEASERIDALGEKLRFLSSESAAAARERVNASSGAEKKIAERDEKIALLIEEGERLSMNELKLQTTIKKLRAQAREAVEAKRKQEVAEKRVAEEKEKLRKALEEVKRAGERIRVLEKSEGVIETLRREKEVLEGSVRELRGKLEEQAKRTVEAEGKVQTEALETERKTTVELRAQVERVQSEAAMMEEKLKGEIADLQGKVERVAEKARAREAGLKAELSVGFVVVLCTSSHSLILGRSWRVRWSLCGQEWKKLLQAPPVMRTQNCYAKWRRCKRSTQLPVRTGRASKAVCWPE
jgi:hypothetical protein